MSSARKDWANDRYQYEDYNKVLAELIESGRGDFLNDVLEIEDTKKRAIAALLYAKISISDIAAIFKLNRKTIQRWKSQSHNPK